MPSGEAYDEQQEKSNEMIARIKEVPFEPVTTRSTDGLLLSGRLYDAPSDAPIAICFHGYRGTAYRDYCGGGWMLIQMGYRVLLIDERAHGSSEGHTITFGVRERADVLCWIKEMTKRFGEKTPIVLFGISMGGASVLMSTALSLPDNVKGIVADCPYNSPEEILRKTIREDAKLPDSIFYPLLKLSAKWFGHFDLNVPSAAQSVKSFGRPILILHGEADTLVPPYMSATVAEEQESIQRETFPGAEHGLSFMVDEERYETLTRDFLSRCLNRKGETTHDA